MSRFIKNSLSILFVGMGLSGIYHVAANKPTQLPSLTSITKQVNHYQDIAATTVTNISTPDNIQSQPPKTDIDYKTAEKRITQKRQSLALAYKQAASRQQKQKVLNDARQLFVNANTQLAPYWYGTPWDFNGTTQTPQKGYIACGYFVTTLLEDAGLKVQRAKLAQQASENIIKSLTTEKHIKRFHNASLSSFVSAIEHWGEGLYIVGLDFHVGFLWHDGDQVHFIHATYVPPKAAFSELAQTSPVLAASKYRVVGKISADDTLIQTWLRQQHIATKT